MRRVESAVARDQEAKRAARRSRFRHHPVILHGMTQPPDPAVTVDLTEPLPSGAPFLAADQDLFLWLVGHLDRPDPFAALEARLDAALGCPSFTGQLALLDDHLNCDLTQLPPPVREKFLAVLRSMVLTATAE
jgi:hypothetical protein